jgi:aminoglycoside phosphotransferase (APT) family kinase protein
MADEPYLDRIVDRESLAAFLSAELGPAAEFSVDHHPDGHSNETLFVTWGDEPLVIRRPPPGETADTAHDVLREYRVMDALQETAVPLPETLFATDDQSVIGSDFFGVERLAGDVIRNDEPERFATPAHRTRIGEELVDALAAIHDTDYEAVGLGDFGRPAGFTDRQVDRWGRQLSWAFEVTADERTVPELDAVGEWLADNVPASHDHTLVHGDYKLDNVMFGPDTPPELTAVLDWELSALGDPHTDLGWLLFFWYESKDPDPAVPELMPTLTAREGYPSRADLVARYESARGVTFEHDRFYRALAAYKLAGLGEMFFRRYLEGNSDDPLYPTMREGVPRLAAHARRVIDGDQPL